MTLDLISGAAAAARFTGLTTRQIYHLVEKGQIPALRLGSRLYFRRFELDCALRSWPLPTHDRIPRERGDEA